MICAPNSVGSAPTQPRRTTAWSSNHRCCTARVVGTHHDHRLAMAFGLIGLRVADVEVDDPDVVSKSWPGYWGVLGSLQ